MRRLVILRHASAAARGPRPGDRQRPLNDAGRAEALRAGAWLTTNDFVADTVLCSTALRTLETWELIAPGMPSAAVEHLDGLYLGAADAYLDAFEASQGDTVLLVGHNPTCAALASDFAGRSVVFAPASLCLVKRTDGGWEDARIVPASDLPQAD